METNVLEPIVDQSTRLDVTDVAPWFPPVPTIEQSAWSVPVSQASGRRTATEAMNAFGAGLPFRGLLKPVAGLCGVALLERAGLDWRVVTAPVDVAGNRGHRRADGYQALVQTGTGKILAITSDKFKPHQNADILRDIEALAAAGDAEIIFAGALDGGCRVVAVARLNGSFNLPAVGGRRNNNHAGPVDDRTELFVVISGGHEVGTPLKVRGLAFRLWCANGAYFTSQAKSTFTVTHRSGIAQCNSIAATYTSIGEEFGTYGSTAQRLLTVPTNPYLRRLYAAEVVVPGTVAQITSGSVASLDALVVRDEARYGRLLPTLIEAIGTQRGSNGENLWTAYNGVTHWVNHARGRSDTSGVDAALFGAGAVLGQRALTVATQFAEAHRG